MPSLNSTKRTSSSTGSRSEKRSRRGQGHAASLVDRVAVDAAAQGRQRHRFAAVVRGQLQRGAIGRRQQLGLARLAPLPDRSHRVDHVSGRQITPAADHGRAGGATSRVAARGFGQDRRPAAAVDRPIDASAGHRRLLAALTIASTSWSVISP